jgi:hypothetical protein
VFGQMNVSTLSSRDDTIVFANSDIKIDHFVISMAAPTAPTLPADSFIVEVPLGYTYHAPIAVGDGQTQEVLLDAGATGSWAVWEGCTQSICQSMSVSMVFPFEFL